MPKNARKSFNLEEIIGSVSNKYQNDLIDNSLVKNQKSDYDVETYEIQGFKIPAKNNKVPESFKIKKSLKKIVEEIVHEAKKSRFNVSKGQIYNYLIEIGLKRLKKN